MTFVCLLVWFVFQHRLFIEMSDMQLLGLAVYFPSACVSSVFMVLYKIFVTCLTLPISQLSLVGLALDLVD